jgi:hypothetical protein
MKVVNMIMITTTTISKPSEMKTEYYTYYAA